jgi:hypothetical protein
MKNKLLVVMIAIMCSHCQWEKSDLQGTWKLDSVYTYYNGFDMTSPGKEPLYHFQDDGRLRMTQGTEFRFFVYEVGNDSLSYHTLDDQLIDAFEILDVDDNKLILKKEKKVLFTEENQERFEIKYFSRVVE